MPRRRRTFIDRSRAKTFQLVQGPHDNPSEHVFVPLGTTDASHHESNALSRNEVIPASDLQQDYERKNYELGEFGFPDDDYDYSKHFKVIGGGGGVYVDAVSRKPKPEAVASSSASRNDKDSRLPKEQVILRESFAAGENDRVTRQEHWRSPEDEQETLNAIEQIKKDRRANKNLDEVIAALDTNGELELTASEHETDSTADALDNVIREAVADESDFLEDDFVALANGDGDNEEDREDVLDGIIEQYREPRLLDAQFERFMEGFEPDDTDDEEEEEIRAELLDQRERMEEFAPHFQEDSFQELWQEEEELLQDLSNLQIEVTEEATGDDPESTGRDKRKENQAEVSRAREFEEMKAAEFERGITGLLDSYKRVAADDAFDAVDGIEGARGAIARAEEEENDRIELGNGSGFCESDGHDSELESHFEEMYKDKEEQWDCETILSTYTNVDNHPSVIDAPASVKRRSVKAQAIIRLDPRTQAPAEFMTAAGATRSSNDEVDYGSKPDRPVNSLRSRGETKEEKKARKAAVKEAARERRALKSEMRKAFGAEHVKQSKHATALGTSKVTLKF